MPLTQEQKDARAAALQKSYADTTAWLIGEHKEEFDAHRAELLEAAGVTWAPKKTQEQRDKEALAEILARNPELAKQVVIHPAAGVPGSTASVSGSSTDAHS